MVPAKSRSGVKPPPPSSREHLARFRKRTLTASSKECARCEQVKPLEDFHRRRARPDGRQSYCKVCNRAADRTWRGANPERKAERNRQWYAENSTHAAEYSEKRRRNHPEIERATQERHPEKFRARRRVQKAVSEGRIDKPDRCEECGVAERDRLQGHHADYSKPLEVEWLCTSCHGKRHRGS